MFQGVSLIGLLVLSALPSIRSCEELLGEHPTQTKAARAQTTTQRASTDDRPQIPAAAREAANALTRFEPLLKTMLDSQAASEELACTDPRLSGPTEARVGFMAQDARFERKDLIPLRVLDRLGSDELTAIRRRYTSTLHIVSAAGFRDPSVAKQAIAEMRAVEALDFVVVYHVRVYREPRLVYMLKTNKREWISGVLSANVGLYDAKTARRLCGTTVSVENDTRDAPIRSRLRTDTRERLIAELSLELARRSTAAFTALGSRLRVPSAGDAAAEEPRELSALSSQQ